MNYLILSKRKWNNKNYLNRYNLKKINSNYIIKGDSLDLSKIINNIMDTNDNSLNMEGMAPGIYFIRVFSGDKSSFEKIIKK